jgi:hypothetical protein
MGFILKMIEKFYLADANPQGTLLFRFFMFETSFSSCRL